MRRKAGYAAPLKQIAPAAHGWSRCVVVLSLLGIFGSTAWSTLARHSPLPSRPDGEGQPTLVHLGAYVVDLTAINEQEQTFCADIVLSWRWHDPRLRDPSAKGIRIAAMNDVWNPRLTIINRRSAEFLYPNMVEIDRDGYVKALQRLSGSAAVPLDLHAFPFDRQDLFLEVVSRGYGPDEVRFVPATERTGRESQLSLAGWSAGKLTMRPFTKTLSTNGAGRPIVLSGFRIAVDAARRPNYYVIREILPLLFIVLMASALFWIPPTEHGLKIGISTAAIFSLMAYYVQLGRSLPRIDYLTRMDCFIVGSTILVFISFSQVIAGMYLVRKKREAAVERMEVWSRAAYPAILFVVSWGSFAGWF